MVCRKAGHFSCPHFVYIFTASRTHVGNLVILVVTTSPRAAVPVAYNSIMEKRNSRCPYMNLLNNREEGTSMSDVEFAMLGASLGG